jgi:beta-lactamase regulating signal transducer with metallopeptidase domain
MVRTVPASNLHTFFIYAFFGSAFAFLLVLLSIRLFALENPRQRMALYLVGLLAPLLGYGLYHTVLAKRCQSSTVYDSVFWRFFDFLCLLGGLALRFLGPVVLIMALFGLLKGISGYLYLQRLRGSAVEFRGTQRQWVEEITAKRCREWNLRRPEIIYTDQPGLSAFILGGHRPAVVVGIPVLQKLSYRDVEGLLTHEFLHIRRGDTLKGWLLHLARGIMFFSPASGHLLGRYLLERERLCDAETAAFLGSSHGYAATLLKVWRLLLEEGLGPRFSVGFTGKKQGLEERVLSLLDGREKSPGLPAPGFFALALAILGLTVFFLGLIC